MKANFIEINSNEELEKLFEQSNDKPVLLFKHSLTCPISAGVHQEIANADADIHTIIVQHSRSLSNAVAERTGIRHESPQAIVLKGGKPIYHAAHYDVTAADVEAHLK